MYRVKFYGSGTSIKSLIGSTVKRSHDFSRCTTNIKRHFVSRTILQSPWLSQKSSLVRINGI